MKWNNMTFTTTKTSPHDLPIRPHAVEVALVGRSNAGKSSLLNMLASKNSLAKTSKTPGKTRHLNLFYVDEHLSIVDLPGYGYAKRSKEEQKDWGGFISDYLKERTPLKLLILVMDVRRKIEEEERMILTLGQALSIPVLLVLNKCDKLNQSEMEKARRSFSEEKANLLLISCHNGRGVENVRKAIEQIAEGGTR